MLVNPDDANELRQGIKKILDDKILRQRLVTNGEKRAAEFSWEKTVRMLQTLIK